MHKTMLNIRASELLNILHSAGHSTAFNSVITSKEYKLTSTLTTELEVYPECRI